MPRWVSIPASIALAFLHGGLWAKTELGKTYCEACRRRLVPLVALATLVVLAVASVGVGLWVRGP